VGSQPLDGKKELAPSSYVRRPSWYEMTLMDVQEQEEAPRSTLRESMPSAKFPNFMALICSVIYSVTSSIQGATDQHGVLMFVASNRYFHIRFVSNMWKSTLMPLRT
jgi:hypothetical protein